MIKSTWPAILESVPRIRQHVQTDLVKIGLDGKAAKQFALAVEEITVNIVTYAYGKQTRDGIEIAVEKTPTGIAIHIADGGVPFNPTQSREPDLDTGVADRRVGGLGLFFVKKLVDEIQYSRKAERNHLTLIKYFDDGGK